MSDLLPLRGYQLECIEAMEKLWADGLTRVAAVLPTGAGKTVVFAHMIKRFREANPGMRVLVLAHTDELVEQAAKKIRDVAPHLRTGIVKASRNEVTSDVVVASVQTLRNAKRRERIKSVGLIIVDECHHSTAKTYRDILEHFDAFGAQSECPWCSPGESCQVCTSSIRVAGFTATFARGDKSKLSEVWEEVAYRKDIVFMIREGYLLNVRGKRVEVPDLDLSKVKKSRGDYSEGELGEAIEHSMAPEVVAKAYVENCPQSSGVLFTPTVSSAYLMSEHLNSAGIRTEVVHGGLATNDRRDILARLATGETQVVSNCSVLTEGFDEPRVSTVVIARPTRSAPLYQQCVGRALRLYPGQSEALVLDVVGASRVHDLRSLVDLSSAKPETDCPDCTLLELEEIAERGALEKPIHYGDVETIEFDPLIRASRRTWLMTRGGTYFLSAGDDAYVFLAPSVAPLGSWDVAWCSKGKAKQDGGFTEHAGVAMEYALAWGEEVASEMGGELMDTYTGKAKSWRREQPSPAQVDLATRLRIPVPEGIRKGDLSKAIDTHLASHRIDPVVTAIIGMRRK